MLEALHTMNRVNIAIPCTFGYKVSVVHNHDVKALGQQLLAEYTHYYTVQQFTQYRYFQPVTCCVPNPTSLHTDVKPYRRYTKYGLFGLQYAEHADATLTYKYNQWYILLPSGREELLASYLVNNA